MRRANSLAHTVATATSWYAPRDDQEAKALARNWTKWGLWRRWDRERRCWEYRGPE